MSNLVPPMNNLVFWLRRHAAAMRKIDGTLWMLLRTAADDIEEMALALDAAGDEIYRLNASILNLDLVHAKAKLNKIASLHTPVPSSIHEQVCRYCLMPWPCPTYSIIHPEEKA